MRIALAQLNPTSGDIEGNTAKVLAAIAEASARGADLLVTPEMVIPGYCIGDLVEDAGFLAANERAIARVAAAATALTAIVGFIDHDPAATNESGTHSQAQRRRGRLPGTRGAARAQVAPAELSLLRRQAILRAGARRAPPSTSSSAARRSGWACRSARTCGTSTMPSSRCPSWRRQGAEILVNINASPFYPGKRQERDQLIRQHVAKIGKPFVYVNTSGAADNGKNIIPFDGESLVYAGDGRLLAVGRQFAEQLLIVDLDPRQPRRSKTLPPLEREREMYDALVMALRDYMRKTGFTRAVVAVSGGIDSALALTIAVDALGRDSVSAFNMPSQFNTERRDRSPPRSRAHFGVHYGVIPIQDIADHIQRVFEEHAHPIARGFTRENLQARIRGILMMAESNDTGALLISCGNETEIALGYATLYGDMCGGISLIGDLSKIDVYRLARHANARHGSEVIPEAAFNLIPSAELAANQFDPFDYAVVAPLVGEMVERRRSPADLLALFEKRALDPDRFLPDADGRTVYDKHTPETFRAVLDDTASRLRRSVYKRLQGPPIVVVSERAFGFDLRETIINGWTGG